MELERLKGQVVEAALKLKETSRIPDNVLVDLLSWERLQNSLEDLNQYIEGERKLSHASALKAQG